MNCGCGQVEVRCLERAEAEAPQSDVFQFVQRMCPTSLSHDPRWLGVLSRGLSHVPYLLLARCDGQVAGILPLAFVKSLLFGRYLVSLPYLNGGGVLASDNLVASRLIDSAVQLAQSLDVRFLELRHERPHAHAALTDARTDKVHMRLALPPTADELWARLKAKVRNQVRKGESQGFELTWGRAELLADFYRVFSRNMRDLGTPAFGRSLFQETLAAFTKEAEICVVRLGKQPVAAAILVHGAGISEVPSASSLREFNSSNANMYMYWRLLCRALERRQEIFDFGRSTPGSGTYRFKEQWGARPHASVWQYHVRKGDNKQMRRDNPKFNLLIRVWRRLPVPVTRAIGPVIVRGIP